MSKLNTNKKTLGICIPYYNNNKACGETFRNLMAKLVKQLTNDMILYIYEDGQASQWLLEYKDKENIIIKGSLQNKGVSYARNQALDYLIDKVKYILFLDSDDIVEDNYLKVMHDFCADNSHEIIESTFVINDNTVEFYKNKVRCGVAGSAIQTKIIGDIRFNEKLQIGEDTTFMHEVCDLTKYRKKHAPTKYIYQLGINRDSLTMLHSRKEIRKER